MIKLYGILDSRASRCLWMLEELGLEYESVPVHFHGDVSQPEYLAINPNGRIPALDDDGLVLFESLAINLHLARKYEGGLWPSDADNQSRAIQWSIWAMTELEPPVGEVVRNRSGLPLPERDSAAATAGEAALRKPVAVLDAALTDGGSLLGGDFSVADLNVLSVLGPAATVGGCDLGWAPRVLSALGRCAARPAVKRLWPSLASS